MHADKDAKKHVQNNKNIKYKHALKIGMKKKIITGLHEFTMQQ